MKQELTGNEVICVDCGVAFLTEAQKQQGGSAVTFHEGKCCICGKNKSVTSIRHYNNLQNFELKEFTGHMKGWKTLGVPPDACKECAVAHAPEQPHNQQSLVFQYNFYDKNGMWPKWEDAMAHCSDAVKEFWRKELKRLGVKEYQSQK